MLVFLFRVDVRNFILEKRALYNTLVIKTPLNNSILRDYKSLVNIYKNIYKNKNILLY